MTYLALAEPHSSWPKRQRGLLIPMAAFLLVVVMLYALTPSGFSYFDFSFMSVGGATIALVAMGATIIILAGGFDLSAGAVVSLIGVVLATHMQDSLASQIEWSVAALGIGALAGAFNGVFVTLMKLPPIVVTLASMFIIEGITLLVMDQPGGNIPQGLCRFLTGDAISELVPAPLIVLVMALVIWALLKNSRLGTGIYAVGSDEVGACAQGVRVATVRFATYVIGGAFYGAGGLFLSAQTGSGDPLIGAPLLLQVFTVTVLGGTRLGGGKGGCLGTVFGAYTLMLAINLLLVLNVSAYYSTVVEGIILVFAALGGSLGRNSTAARYIGLLLLRWRASRDGTLPSSLGRSQRRRVVDSAPSPRADDELRGPWWRRWATRNQDMLRHVLPPYLLFATAALATRLHLGEMPALAYLNSILVLASFLAVLGLGQGAVILTGGLDLSLPWMIALCGIVFTGTVQGSNEAAAWALPMVLAAGLLVGLANGASVAFLGLPPIVATLAMNGILQGVALVYDNGTPQGWSAPALRWFMVGEVGGMTPVAWFTVAFAGVATMLLRHTTFGRCVYAIGNGARAARLSGVGVGTTLLAVYALSGFCSSLVGVMLTGLSGQAFNGMGDKYLLASFAAIAVGGVAMTGGRGHYLGIFGGALALTALSTALAGSDVPHAVQHIIFGAVVLGAAFALRERSV